MKKYVIAILSLSICGSLYGADDVTKILMAHKIKSHLGTSISFTFSKDEVLFSINKITSPNGVTQYVASEVHTSDGENFPLQMLFERVKAEHENQKDITDEKLLRKAFGPKEDSGKISGDKKAGNS